MNEPIRGAHRLIPLGGLALLALMALSGCSTPKYVTGSTANIEHIKLMYYQRSAFSAKQGVVKCDVDAAGALSNCREMKIIFEGEDK